MDLWVKVAASILIVTVSFWLHRRFRRPRNLPPGPFPLPVIGNFHNLGKAPHRSLAGLAKIRGPLMSLQLGNLTAVVASSPAMAQLVLQKHDLLFCNRWIADAVRGSNHHRFSIAFLPVDATWRTLRKICNTLIFSNKSLDLTQHLRQKKIEDLLSYVHSCSQDGLAVNVGHAVFSCNLGLISNTILSLDLGDPNSDFCHEFQRISNQLVSVAGLPNIADYFPMLKFFDPQRIRCRMDQNYGKLLDFFRRMIDQRLETQKETLEVKKDVLDALLEMIRERGEEFDMSHLTHLLVDLFIGGTDTTSNTIEWAMAELLREPSKLKKAQAELNQVVGRGNPIKEVDIARLPYLQAVAKETLRLHPTFPLLVPRTTSSDVELGEFTVPKGSQVLINVWAIGRDPSVWERPSCFEPERFLGANIDLRGLHFELTPFGGGRRICPGLPLGIRSIHLILGSLIHSFDWKLEDGVNPESMDMDERFGLTLQKAKSLLAVPVSV